MGPLKSMQPSNQSSQLTLQLGSSTLRLSMIMNFGCMTLNGKTNMLLICKSKPVNSSAEGKPKVLCQLEGEYVFPFNEGGCKSFWNKDDDEKYTRTLISFPISVAFAASFRSESFSILEVSD